MIRSYYLATVLTVLGLTSVSFAQDDASSPNSASSFNGDILLVATNALGEITGATLRSPGNTYIIITDEMSSAEKIVLLAFHDKRVSLKGEIKRVNDKLALKIVGAITDLTPPMTGVRLTSDKDGLFRLQGSGFPGPLTVSTNSITPEMSKKLQALTGKLVDCSGRSSASQKLFYLSDIRESIGVAASSKSAKNTAKDKKTKSKAKKK